MEQSFPEISGIVGMYGVANVAFLASGWVWQPGHTQGFPLQWQGQSCSHVAVPYKYSQGYPRR